MEAHHHLARQTSAHSSFVIGPQCQADGLQPQVGSAAFVGYREAVAADPKLASLDDGKPDASCSNDNNATIPSGVRANTGDGRVVDVD